MGKHSAVPVQPAKAPRGSDGGRDHPGRSHAALPPPRPPRSPRRGRRIATYAGGALLTALAWVVLVYLAIQLGPDVKDGEPRAWALMGVATIGAMASLFLALILGGRVLEVLRAPAGDVPAERPLTPPGGRRAKR